jgi:dTMP kinase
MFITLEGPDGSGKSTQLPPLADHLQELGYDVLTTREPGGTRIGGEVRQTLLNLRSEGMHPRSEILLFLAARAQLVEEVIRPALQRGTIVISDRYGDSTLAYQGYGSGADLDTLRQLLSFATGSLQPDLTVLFDIDAAEGIRRRQAYGGEWNRLDANPQDYHDRVRQGYLELAALEPQRWVKLDASQSRQQVQAGLRQVILERLKQAGIRPALHPVRSTNRS